MLVFGTFEGQLANLARIPGWKGGRSGKLAAQVGNHVKPARNRDLRSGRTCIGCVSRVHGIQPTWLEQGGIEVARLLNGGWYTLGCTTMCIHAARAIQFATIQHLELLQ